MGVREAEKVSGWWQLSFGGKAAQRARRLVCPLSECVSGATRWLCSVGCRCCWLLLVVTVSGRSVSAVRCDATPSCAVTGLYCLDADGRRTADGESSAMVCSRGTGSADTFGGTRLRNQRVFPPLLSQSQCVHAMPRVLPTLLARVDQDQRV